MRTTYKVLARIAPTFLLLTDTAFAAENEDPTQNSEGQRDVIVVYGRAIEQIGTALSGSEGTIGYADFENKPLSRMGELVENVPGVIATQHSGTGKANQFFLRGFKLDHGTDFAAFVDGVPINMRSHGHGQGYLDLNFIIPELVERIDYRKGPYFADVGDFSAAGTVRFRTIGKLDAPLAEASLGSFGYARGLVAGSAGLGSGDVLIALEGTSSNGPWVLDEKLRKVSGALKCTTGSDERRVSIGLTGYRATWQATDQVPERVIAAGVIDRFGFIDPDLRGFTTRLAATANAQLGATSLNAFAIHYDFGLTSNFTYFLEDPVNGDEFEQRDRRQVYGGSAAHEAAVSIAGLPTELTIGGDLRLDRIGKVGLYRSIDGQAVTTVRQDRVEELSAAAFVQAQVRLTERWRINFGLRGDYYDYTVTSDRADNSGDGDDAILSPKLALAWRPADQLELYANYGESFHSNDVRGATIAFDPVSGDPAEPVPVLVRARGAELGGRFEVDSLTATAAAFYLDLASELVFVGDAGATEANDGSRRWGLEASLFWRPRPWLTLDGSAAFTRARFAGVGSARDRIPGAVENVFALGAATDLGSGVSASVRLRHFGSAPLIEDGSVRSDPTTLVNLGVYYQTGRVRIGVDMLNAFDTEDADITYFYASRLPGEPVEGVEDRHLHPVEPRQARVAIRVTF